jgi:hypothetical protein
MFRSIRSAHQDRCDGRHKTVDSPVGEAGLVGGDVVDGVGCDLRCVEDDVGDERAVEVGFDAEALRNVRCWRERTRKRTWQNRRE